MADEMKMNFKALKRVDPYIEKIEDFATQVALYKYASSEWEKLDIEGTLFVNRRQDDPKYGFIILNRLSDKNLVEPVTKELDFQVHTPFLLYKNKEGSIFGIWFFDPKECERIHKKMESCVRIVEKRLLGEAGQSKATTNGDDNIISLLQKASMEEKMGDDDTRRRVLSSSPAPAPNKALLQLLNNGKEDPEPSKAPANNNSSKGKSKEEPPASNPNSVADFFAKASKNGSAFSTPLLTSSAGGPAVALGAPTFSPAGVMHHHPLMPMPPGPVSIIPLQGFHGLGGPTHPVHVPVALHQSWQQQSADNQSSNATNENAATQRLFSIPGSYPLEMIERSQRGDDSGASTPHFQPITPGKGAPPPQQQKLFKAATPKGTEPELMSPMAFAHNPLTKKSQQNATAAATANNDNSIINGIHLNEGQLVQALKHLLTNDSTFVTKLHKAYLEVAKST